MHKYCKFCNINNGELPPCAKFLNNSAPLISDDMLIYRNLNGIYCFLSVNPSTNNKITTSVNLQISISNFIIGLYISQIQDKIIEYDSNAVIHNNKKANNFVHKALSNNISIDEDLNASLIFFITNNNAILPLYTATIDITPLNLYIIIVLHVLENNPALYFGNNDHTFENAINFYLASLSLKFPFAKFKECMK